MTDSGIAPADQRERRPWPTWQKVLAYVALAAMAVASVLYIDRGVKQAEMPAARSVPADDTP